MTFSELTLVLAIHSLRPGSRDYITSEQRLRFALRVQRAYCTISGDCVFPYTTDDVLSAYMKYRKSPDTQTKAAIAAAHGARCFWRDRDKGGCSDEVEAGHLIPNSDGGPLSVKNCIIECRAHNNQRSTKTVEEYLLSDLRTVGTQFRDSFSKVAGELFQALVAHDPSSGEKT